MEVGDLIKRRNNGDLAIVLRVFKEKEVPSAVVRKQGFMEIVRLSCGNIQHVWDYEYEVINENR